AIAPETRLMWGLFRGSLRLSGEMLRQALPAVEIILLQLRRFQGETRRPDDVTAFEHEGERVLDLVRRERNLARLVEGRRIGAVAGHAVVEARTARREAFRLGIVDAVDESHELAHHVAMKPRRPERML